MYRLSDEVAHRIQVEGMSYFLEIEKSGLIKSFGGVRYREWRETAIICACTRETDNERDRCSDWYRDDEVSVDMHYTLPNVRKYLNRYGYDIPMREDVEAMINDAISREGSYYAYSQGCGAVLIVSPAMRRVFYVYAG